mmetsp:Transcript_2205/g.3760  ORF Transcript_2205/g.3760 Transcript_2205/m.3760 type:complete len:336 (-) Transcript_2205:570-1577(-)
MVCTTTAPSTPAFLAICMQGCLKAALIASTPTCWSMEDSCTSCSFLVALSSAVPPPGTMPSSSAALVAFRESFRRSLISLTSTSLAPPTLITATPPLSFARRSFILSFSYSDVLISIASRIDWQHSSMAALSPAPSKMTVSSFPMEIERADPNSSSLTSSNLPPTSSEINVVPVRTARSFMMAFLLSPKPGALTAATLSPPRSLFTMSIAKASLSTSSAMMSNGLCVLATCSKIGRIAWTEEIFFSCNNTKGLSSSTFCVLLSVIKYGEMYPRSSFIPSTTSSSCSKVLPSETVIVPSLPTFSKACVMSPPTAVSPFAAIVATLRMASGESIMVA